ncbi:MAG: prepilin peptidase [Anaerotignaceae bacterium]
MLYMYFLPIYIFVFLFGICIGSFLNVVVYRVPLGQFFAEERSFCPSCKTQLRWIDLIPIFSYVFLGGKCAHCKEKISCRYPIVEGIAGLLAVFSFIRFEFDYKTIHAFGVLMILLAIALIDFDTMEIPDCLNFALIPFAVVAIWLWEDVTLLERAIGFFIVSLPLFLITMVIPNAFGGGDIKLMGVCGFLLGWQNTILAFFIALVLGGGYASFLLSAKKTKKGTHIAFGPYICIGVAVSLFYGAEIIGFYLKLFM